MFLEGTYGHSQNELAGCALAQDGTGPAFCQSALPMNPIGNRITAGLGGLPMLFPDALALNPRYYAYRRARADAAADVAGRPLLKTPNFTWGGRVANAPPNIPFPGFLNINATDDISISLTKLRGPAHDQGRLLQHAQLQGAAAGQSVRHAQRSATTRPTRSTRSSRSPTRRSGIFSQYQQQSKYIEGTYVYNNTEAFIQDNWKVNEKLTLDYGVRFVHQQPQYDELRQASNFFLDEWSPAQAPALYVAGCANGAVTCTGTNRQARNPVTGQFLGPNSTVAIGTLVPNTGDRPNGLFRPGRGSPRRTTRGRRWRWRRDSAWPTT